MISIIVPVLNEEESLEVFYQALIASFSSKETYEILFIDDGSTDNSLSILKSLAKKDTRIKIFAFRKNHGKAEALTVGFHHAEGEFIVTLDADLQDKPSEINKLVEKAREGWDVVSGWRKDRKDKVHKILSSKLFNFIAGSVWGLQLHDYNCGLKVYSKEAAKSLQLYGGMHRFIPLIAFKEGFRVCEVPVIHAKRQLGKSKYGFSKLWKDLPDLFTMLFLTQYSKKPLHFFGLVGGILFFVGFCILTYLSVLHFYGESIGRRPLLFLGMLLILGGLQVLFTGFIADLIISISHTHGTQEQPSSLFKYTSK